LHDFHSLNDNIFKYSLPLLNVSWIFIVIFILQSLVVNLDVTAIT
jgi:hypothetical protein